MTLIDGANKVRQVARRLEDIRADHLARYRLAAGEARRRGLSWAFDVGCGVGYGSWILAEEGGLVVFGYDRDEESIEYAEEHYRHIKVLRAVRDLETLRIWSPKKGSGRRPRPYSPLPGPPPPGPIGVQAFGMVAAFEIIEHSRAAPAFLAHAARKAWLLVGSVPNEELVPFTPGKVNPEHYRHYTADEICAELDAAGWRVVMLGGQTGQTGAGAVVRRDTAGARTLVFVAKSQYLERPRIGGVEALGLPAGYPFSDEELQEGPGR